MLILHRHFRGSVRPRQLSQHVEQDMTGAALVRQLPGQLQRALDVREQPAETQLVGVGEAVARSAPNEAVLSFGSNR
jgi:hypothetical protein